MKPAEGTGVEFAALSGAGERARDGEEAVLESRPARDAEESLETEPDGRREDESAQVGRFEAELGDRELGAGQGLRQRLRREVEEMLLDVESVQARGESAAREPVDRPPRTSSRLR